MSSPSGVALPHSQVIGLDLIRFAAALLVVFYHLGFYCWIGDYSTTQKAFGGVATLEDLAPFTWFGWVGVEIFFVLSGFVIAYTANGAVPFQFLSTRALRLFPAAWACGLVTFVVVAVGHLAMGRDLLVETVHTAVLWPFGPWLDGAYWTLGIEMSFYGLILLLLAGNRMKWLESAATALAVLSAAFWLLSLVPGLAVLDVLAETRKVQLLLLPHGLYFAAGIMLWSCVTFGVTARRVAVIALVLAGSMIEIAHVSATVDPSKPAGVPILAFWVAFAAMVASLRWNDVAMSRFGRHARGIRIVGLSTYPLYLLHNVAGAFTLRLLILQGVSRYLAVAVAIGLYVALAFLVATRAEPLVKKVLRPWLERVGRALRRVTWLAGVLFARTKPVTGPAPRDEAPRLMEL